MLKLPLKATIFLASIFSITLGAHGVWVYFSRLELLFGAEGTKLFLLVEVPIRLQPIVEFMSAKGLQSWVIPAGLIGLGLLLWGWQSRIYIHSTKLPRWLW